MITLRELIKIIPTDLLGCHVKFSNESAYITYDFSKLPDKYLNSIVKRFDILEMPFDRRYLKVWIKEEKQ